MQIEHLPEISLLFLNHLLIVAVPSYRLKTIKKNSTANSLLTFEHCDQNEIARSNQKSPAGVVACTQYDNQEVIVRSNPSQQQYKRFSVRIPHFS